MAQKIQTLFIDDIDGSEAEGTVRFGLDGAEYEIDLNAKHAEALRKSLAKYIDAARRSTGTTRRPARIRSTRISFPAKSSQSTVNRNSEFQPQCCRCPAVRSSAYPRS